MGRTVLIYSLKPESPDVNLDSVLDDVKKLNYFSNYEKKPFMFGMDMLLITFVLPEGIGPDETEQKLKEIKGIGSVEQEAITLA